MQVTAISGDTLDLICWQQLGTTSGGTVEQAFARNPALADLGAIIPPGTIITLPDNPPATSTPVRDIIQLWD